MGGCEVEMKERGAGKGSFGSKRNWRHGGRRRR